jgi:hypothetical protein
MPLAPLIYLTLVSMEAMVPWQVQLDPSLQPAHQRQLRADMSLQFPRLTSSGMGSIVISEPVGSRLKAMLASFLSTTT